MFSLNSERIKTLMDIKGIQIRVYDSIDSTNTEAKRIFRKGSGDMLLCAKMQTAGRGRQGKSFYSPENTGVYFSLVLDREMPLNIAARATTAAAVAVTEAIEELTDKKPKIKWVNDVFLENKKVCGILTEAISSDKSGVADALVIGIGINVSTAGFPDEIKDIAGSLDEESLDRNLLTSKITEKILEFANDFENPEIIEEYRARSLVIGRQISFEKDGKTQTATALDIDKDCGLVIKLPDGETQTLTSGEISIKLD